MFVYTKTVVCLFSQHVDSPVFSSEAGDTEGDRYSFTSDQQPPQPPSTISSSEPPPIAEDYDDEDEDDDIQVIDLENESITSGSVAASASGHPHLRPESGNADLDDLVRPLSPQGSSSIVTVSEDDDDAIPSSPEPQPQQQQSPSTKDEVVIVSNNETTLIADVVDDDADAQEDDHYEPVSPYSKDSKDLDVSPDMSHVSVVVVGEDDEDVRVVDSRSSSHIPSPRRKKQSQQQQQHGGIMSNGVGELSDLSRSVSSASQTSSEFSKAGSSLGRTSFNDESGLVERRNMSGRGGAAAGAHISSSSPTSIILEGSTVTATDTDDTVISGHERDTVITWLV